MQGYGRFQTLVHVDLGQDDASQGKRESRSEWYKSEKEVHHPKEDRADNSLKPAVCAVAEVFLLEFHNRRQRKNHHEDEWNSR